MEHDLGNIFVRTGTIAPGEQIVGHEHNFDHVTYCSVGRIRILGVDRDGTEYETVIEAGQYALVRADVQHTLINEPGLPKEAKSILDSVLAELTDKFPGAAELVAELVSRHLAVHAHYHCIYAHREPQGDVVQRYTGWPEAYR